jgi:hypothetical protein
MDREKLIALVGSLEKRPTYMPSASWEDHKREGAVLSREDAGKIAGAIVSAPEVQIAGAFKAIVGVLKGFIV